MITITEEYLNHVIRGLIKFRKCPSCDETGYELKVLDFQGKPCSKEDANYSGPWVCEDCDGVGYIEVPK